jgi:two-component system sensor histidine kinase KdpD
VGALPARRGHMKVFLGYAAGVGKTYRMLEEAQQMKRLGQEIVVGYFEPHGRRDTMAKMEGLELIPRKKIEYRGAMFEEMDFDAIFSRRPATCVVDELAHTNVPGSERLKRWEDVQVLLDIGIDVVTNMNIQHLESLNDQVLRISGVRVRETVPDWFVKSADEVVMVDATTEALFNRLRRGDIYAPEKAQRAMDNFFKESTLVALRELAMRQTAHELKWRSIDGVADARVGEEELAGQPSPQPQPGAERVLIYAGIDASTAMLIRRGRRMADYLGADCFAVSVVPHGGEGRLPRQDRDLLERHLNFAKNLRIETRIVESDDAANAIVDFAHRNRVTQILLSRCNYSSWNHLLGKDFILRVVRSAKNLRVIIVAERGRSHPR